jgi:H+-translocating NAD(P) transhydrogenase subunit alpha
MKIAVPSETTAGENRVAASPDSVKAFVKKGLKVSVQSGAGAGANISDAEFAAAGAEIVKGAGVVKDADIVLCIRRPADAVLKAVKKGAVLVGGLEPHGERKALEVFAKFGVTAFAMELMPRISRAQSMDILS